MKYTEVGCVGGYCTKKNRCKKYLERGEFDRSGTFHSPPYNIYDGAHGPEIVCNYYEYKKEEGEEG